MIMRVIRTSGMAYTKLPIGLDVADDSSVPVDVRNTSIDVARKVTWRWMLASRVLGTGNESSMGVEVVDAIVVFLIEVEETPDVVVCIILMVR